MKREMLEQGHHFISHRPETYISHEFFRSGQKEWRMGTRRASTRRNHYFDSLYQLCEEEGFLKPSENSLWVFHLDGVVRG